MSGIFKNKIKKALALLMCTGFILGSASLLGYRPVKAFDRDFLSYSPKQGDIEKAKEEREEARKKADQAADKVRKLKGEKSELSGELAELKGLSDEQMAQYETIAEEYAAAILAKRDALDEYIKSQENLVAKREEYSKRVSIMFAYENKSTLEILLSSDSIAGFFTNLQMIALIGDADRQMLDQLTIAMDDAELKSQYALQEAEDMQAVAEEKSAQLNELQSRIGKTTAKLEEKSSQINSWMKKEDSFRNEADRLDEEIRRLQREKEEEERRRREAAKTPTPKPGNGGGSGGGGGGGTGDAPKPKMKMTWPYPGDYTIYSPYGWRIHPVYKTRRMHWGVDLGGTYGNPIVAAASGTVLKVEEPVEGQNTGGANYGNYCIIDHGNGICTLYGHTRDVYVKVGDKVKAGQTIAECGSTGTSTGPHLHFEVRVNGSKVDPAPYIKG